MSKYNTKIGDKICEHTATSSIGLRHICKQLGMPYSTVTNWIYDKHHELYEKYTRAKRLQLYHLEEEILEIADDSTNDYMTIVRNGKTTHVLNREAISRSRLRIQARVTLITKLAPKTRIEKATLPDGDVNIDITGNLANTPASTPAYATSPSPSERAGERSPSSSPKNALKPPPYVHPGDTVYKGSYPRCLDQDYDAIERTRKMREEYEEFVRQHPEFRKDSVDDY